MNEEKMIIGEQPNENVDKPNLNVEEQQCENMGLEKGSPISKF